MMKFYYAGAARIAVREGSADPVFLLGDHLGSTSVAVGYDGLPPREAAQLYKAWGEPRFTQGSLPTDYQYTGQQHVASIGLYYYGARWYDPLLGRFAQPDSIIPNPINPGDYDRYAYVRNNPVKYRDPTGHWSCGDLYDPACAESDEEIIEFLLMEYNTDPQSGSSNPDEIIPDFWTTEIHASGALVEFILDWEKYSSTVYWNEEHTDCTIGFGHNCTKEDPSIYEGWDIWDFWELFLKDLAEAEAAVRNAFQELDNKYYPDIKGYQLGENVPITQKEFDALVDFAFNAGWGSVNTLITNYLVPIVDPIPVKNIKNFENALKTTYSTAGGIEIRRTQEFNIFFDGNYDSTH